LIDEGPREERGPFLLSSTRPIHFEVIMSELEINIAPATADDVPIIKTLLESSSLPTAGIEEHWRTFIVAKNAGDIVGCGGSEAHQFAALIRSIAVKPEFRSHGIGRRIVRQLLDRLASRGIREFYLLTNDAEEYFRKRGFKPIDRDEVHPQLLSSPEFSEGVCDSAVCMRLVMMT
jgi:N-acetylglutamate synthase-like GNAT family acetyltransferase